LQARLQAAKKKGFTGASGTIFLPGVGTRKPGHMHEQIRQGTSTPSRMSRRTLAA